MATLQMSQLSGMNCHYAHHTFSYFLDRLVENGLENVEIWGASPHFHVEDATPERIRATRQALRERGLRLVCFTPETVVYPINIAALEDDIRERSVRTMLRAVECAAELGAPKMLLTPGWGYITEPREEALKLSMESIARITRRAEELDILLALEHLSPISSNLMNTSAHLKTALDQIGSAHLKAMIDTCQVGLAGEHVRDYFEALGKDLIHVHIVDGTPGGHLSFGDGTIPLEEYVRTMGDYGYDGYLSMEIADRRYFAHPEQADRDSIAKFREWIAA